MEITGSIIRDVTKIDGELPYFSASRKYRLSRLNLVRAGYPTEIQNDIRLQPLNKHPGMPIVVEKNRNRYGEVPSLNYCAPAIVIAGAARRARLLKEGNTRAWGWVEKGALAIQADDAMSSQELLEKLQALLMQKLASPSIPNSALPWLIAFYPFESYLIYSLSGLRYRQGYNLNPSSRDVMLAGPPVEVEEKLVNSNAQRDLMRCTASRWSIPREAVRMYLSDVKTGLFEEIKCSSYLPQSNEQIFRLLDQNDVFYMNFVLWSLQEQKDLSYKAIQGQRYSRDRFQGTDKQDKSTWTLKKYKA